MRSVKPCARDQSRAYASLKALPTNEELQSFIYTVRDGGELPIRYITQHMLGGWPYSIYIGDLQKIVVDKVLKVQPYEQVFAYEEVNGRKLENKEGLYRVGELLIYATYYNKTCFFTIYYNPEHQPAAHAFAKRLGVYQKGPSPKAARINVIRRVDREFELMEFEVPRRKLDIGLHYGAGFVQKFDYLVKQLNQKDRGGLVVLHGQPGTGKTMLIRHLASKVRAKQIIFLPAEMAEHLASPDLLSFLYNYENSIIVIEEAERILRSRKLGEPSPALANILNATDGLLKDLLQLQVICTFNSERESIDPALLRNGRLILLHEFAKLTEDEARQLVASKGLDVVVTGPMALSEIFNAEQPFGAEVIQKNGRVGFTVAR